MNLMKQAVEVRREWRAAAGMLWVTDTRHKTPSVDSTDVCPS